MSSIRRIVALLLMLVVSRAISAAGVSADHAAQPGRLLFSDDFAQDRSSSDIAHEGRWAIEQQPGGSVSIRDGRLVIEDKGGCTMWFMRELTAPVVITYEATASSKARVSDLNCFWMATDPKRATPPDPFTLGFGRSGKFEDYDSLRTYYVGCGGNNNTTTRFRRYGGDGSKPLLPEHDLGAAKYMLTPDRTYAITLIAANGRAQFIRDGEVLTDFRDPAPLEHGCFGFRTVLSRIEIRKFRVYEAKVHDAAAEKPAPR